MSDLPMYLAQAIIRERTVRIRLVNLWTTWPSTQTPKSVTRKKTYLTIRNYERFFTAT